MKRISGMAIVAAVLAGSAGVSAAGESAAGVEVVVALRPGTAENDVAREAGLFVASGVIPSRRVYRMSTPPIMGARARERAAKEAVDDLEHDRRVEWAASVLDIEAADERFHAWPNGAPEAIPPEAVDVQEAFRGLGLTAAHAIATGRGVIVAVLDTGADTAHPILNGHLMTGYDMVDDDAEPVDVADGVDGNHDGVVDRAFGHGTFVSGIVRQIAPDATILPVRVLDDEGRGSIAAIVEGIEYAVESGAQVINLSLGIAGKVGLTPVKDALKRARKAGATIVAAAGNVGDRTQLFPASEKDVVGVTALGDDLRSLATFANRGTWVDVAAPGVNIVSAVPGGGYARWGGSSMAVGVVSGQLALLAERNPTRLAKDWESMIYKSCRRGIAKETEHGVVDVLASLARR